MDLTLTLERDTPAEHRAAGQLRRLLAAHDLSPWMVTRTIRTAEGVIPHSHPVLTLNTRHLDDDPAQLSCLLHEQIHWGLSARWPDARQAIEALWDRYPDMPDGPPQGARDRQSGVLHLIVNLWGLDALTRVLDRPTAERIVRAKDYYTWIYATVLTDEPPLRQALSHFGLDRPPDDGLVTRTG